MAPLRWQHTIVVQSTCTCTIFGAKRHRGTARQPYAAVAPVSERHRGAANVHVRHRGAIFGAERYRGAAPTALRRRGACPMTGHHRGALKVHVCRRGATFRAERHRGAAQTAMHRRGASSVVERGRDAGNVHVHCRFVPFTAERRVSPPRQSCADVAQAEWQSTTAVPPPCARAGMTRFSRASLAMVYPPGQYSRHHGGSAPGARPTSVTPRAEVTCHRRYSPTHLSSANLAVPLGHRRGAFFCVTCCLGARIVGLVVCARPLRPGVVGDIRGDAPPWCYGCDACPALTKPEGYPGHRQCA